MAFHQVPDASPSSVVSAASPLRRSASSTQSHMNHHDEPLVLRGGRSEGVAKGGRVKIPRAIILIRVLLCAGNQSPKLGLR